MTTPLKTRRKRRWFLPVRKHPLRLTSLWYLREALIQERYEECAQMIAIAKEFGADPHEVQFLLEDPRRLPRR